MVIRNVIQHRADHFTLFFIAIDENADPRDSFRALADLHVKTRKASRAVKEDGLIRNRSRYSDRLTHEQGARVAVSKLRWLAHDRVEVDGEIDVHSMFYQRGTLVIEKVKSRWVIVCTKETRVA